jgi:hypothetical protein
LLWGHPGFAAWGSLFHRRLQRVLGHPRTFTSPPPFMNVGVYSMGRIMGSK